MDTSIFDNAMIRVVYGHITISRTGRISLYVHQDKRFVFLVTPFDDAYAIFTIPAELDLFTDVVTQLTNAASDVLFAFQIQLRIALMPDSRFVWVCWNACSLLLWPFLCLWMERK